MANNKTQKRKAKLKKRTNKRVINNTIQSLVYVNKTKIVNTIPDEQERLSYIKALITDMDNTITQ